MSVLPPGLESMSSHTFGMLCLQITNVKTSRNIELTHLVAEFFGENTDENINSSNQTRPYINQIGDKIQYKIVTHQWLFYMYLSDIEHLKISFLQPKSKNSVCFIKVPIELRSAKEVMTPEFRQPNILKSNQITQHTIVDSKGNTYGTAGVRIWTEFNLGIHQQIKELVNFQQLVVFQGISPINSQTELPREPPQQLSAITVRTTKTETKNKNILMLQSPQQPSLEHVQPEQVHDEEHQSRLLQDDIDRMIAQMRNRPYDCSRYQDNQENQQKDYSRSSRQQDISNTNKQMQIKNNTYSIMSGYSKIEEFHQSNNKLQQTEASLKHSNSMGMVSMARPPSYSPHHSKVKIEQPQQTVINKSPRILKQSQTSQLSPQYFAKTQNSNSYMQLKVHEMLVSISNALPHTVFQQLMQPCYTIKIYLNNDQEQYFAAQGIKQGEIIVFNQSLKIRNINSLKSIRFTICDDYGKVECEGIFDLTRLYASRQLKRVFTVPLLGFSPNSVQSKVKLGQEKLVEVSPLHRTLRIECELVQKIEMVQIFMKVWKINLQSNLIRYKIPLTKQTIQHVGSSHVNIFPHTCSTHIPDKLMMQFWNNEQNVGQAQISLKNIKNTNVSILNSNIDPVYLYDGKKQIRNMLEGDRVVGDFMLTLCFGTVKQMQSLLLAAMNQQKDKIQQHQASRVQATLDERLGVIINKKPTVNQISIQVEMEPERVLNGSAFKQSSHDAKFNGEPSFGDQSIISHNSHNEFMDASLVSFAKHNQQHSQQQQHIIKIEKIKPTISYPTVTEKVSETIAELLSSLVLILPKLKELCKPHLVYNFINANKLKQILLKLGIKDKIIEMVFKLVLFVKTDMVNVNILYDLIMSVQIQGSIKPNFISDQMLIVGAMRLLYGKEKLRKTILLESEMQFRQMVELYKKVQLKLTLHQYNTLQKFINKYKSKKDAEDLKAAIIRQLESQTVTSIQQCFYQQDILKQIYGDDSSSMNSFNYSHAVQQSVHHSINPIKQLEEEVPRFSNFGNKRKQIQRQQKPISNFEKTKDFKKDTTSIRNEKLDEKLLCTQRQNFSHKISIGGVQNAIESVQCVFDQVPEGLYIKITIESPIAKEIKFEVNEPERSFSSAIDLKDADGKVYLISKEKSIACAAFSLIKGVKSLYALKTNEGEFCGLLHLLLI